MVESLNQASTETSPAEPPSVAVRRLIELIRPDNLPLLTRWVKKLEETGGIYTAMDMAGRTALAAETVGLLSRLCRGEPLPDHAANRYAVPPPYRDQPITEFVMASMAVGALLRDYLTEQAPDPATGAQAIAIVDPIMANAVLRVIQLREQLSGGGRLVAVITDILRNATLPHIGFRAVAERLAADLNADLCLICVVDQDALSVYSTSRKLTDHNIEPGTHVPRDEARWLEYLERDQIYDRRLVEGSGAIESRLLAAGFKTALVQPLTALGRLVGLLILLKHGERRFDARVGRHLQSVAPVVASNLGFSRQLGTLERAEVAIQELYDTAPTMMCALDRLQRIVRTNQRFREELGIPEDVVGMPLSWLVHPAWHERFISLWSRIQEVDAVAQRRVDLITADGERLPVSLEAHWLRDELGTARQCVVALWNISAHVAREAAQKLRIDDLSAFAHHVAHDLKAPLRTVSSFASLLFEELPNDTPEDLRGYVQGARRAAEHGGRMVESLLRFAHSTTDRGAAKPVRLQEIVKSACIQLAADLDARHGNVVVVCDEFPLLGRRGALTTLLVNLVGNALSYTDGDNPTVEVGVEGLEPGWASLFVRDHGIGIAEEDRERIFEIFQRSATDREGTGVGLAIVRRIAHAHGGEIEVRSELGEGSTFSVRLPTP